MYFLFISIMLISSLSAPSIDQSEFEYNNAIQASLRDIKAAQKKKKKEELQLAYALSQSELEAAKREAEESQEALDLAQQISLSEKEAAKQRRREERAEKERAKALSLEVANREAEQKELENLAMGYAMSRSESDAANAAMLARQRSDLAMHRVAKVAEQKKRLEEEIQVNPNWDSVTSSSTEVNLDPDLLLARKITPELANSYSKKLALYFLQQRWGTLIDRIFKYQVRLLREELDSTRMSIKSIESLLKDNQLKLKKIWESEEEVTELCTELKIEMNSQDLFSKVYNKLRIMRDLDLKKKDGIKKILKNADNDFWKHIAKWASDNNLAFDLIRTQLDSLKAMVADNDLIVNMLETDIFGASLQDDAQRLKIFTIPEEYQAKISYLTDTYNRQEHFYEARPESEHLYAEYSILSSLMKNVTGE